MTNHMWTTLHNNIDEIDDLYLDLAATLPIYVFMPDYLAEFYRLRQETYDLNIELNHCDHEDYDVEPLVEKTSDLINKYTDLTMRVKEAVFDPDSDYSVEPHIDAHPDRDTILELQEYLNDKHYDSNMVIMDGDEVRQYYSNYKEFYNFAVASSHSHRVVLPNPYLYTPHDLVIKVHTTLVLPILDSDNFFTVYRDKVITPHS